MFCAEKNWRYILWNNKQILINNKTVYYKSYFEAGVVHISDLSFDLNKQPSLPVVVLLVLISCIILLVLVILVVIIIM